MGNKNSKQAKQQQPIQRTDAEEQSGVDTTSTETTTEQRGETQTTLQVDESGLVEEGKVESVESTEPTEEERAAQLAKEEAEAAEAKAKADAEEEAKAEALRKEIQEQSQEADKSKLFSGSKVAQAVAEQLKVYVDFTKVASDEPTRIARQTAMMRVLRGVVGIGEGNDFIATIDMVLKAFEAERNGAFALVRVNQYSDKVKLSGPAIREHQTIVTWLYAINDHKAEGSKFDYYKQFSEEHLQDVFPGLTGERMISYARRICQQK